MYGTILCGYSEIRTARKCFLFHNIMEMDLTNTRLRDRMAWQLDISSFIRSDTQEAEGAPLLRE